MKVIRETKWLSSSGKKMNTNSLRDKVESIGRTDFEPWLQQTFSRAYLPSGQTRV